MQYIYIILVIETKIMIFIVFLLSMFRTTYYIYKIQTTFQETKANITSILIVQNCTLRQNCGNMHNALQKCKTH